MSDLQGTVFTVSDNCLLNSGYQQRHSQFYFFNPYFLLPSCMNWLYWLYKVLYRYFIVIDFFGNICLFQFVFSRLKLRGPNSLRPRNVDRRVRRRQSFLCIICSLPGRHQLSYKVSQAVTSTNTGALSLIRGF